MKKKLSNKLKTIAKKLNAKVIIIFSILILIAIFAYSIPEKNNESSVPRVMFWTGKVNQHWDLQSQRWSTDPDAFSGAEVDKLSYCRKFYPSTVKVVEYKLETIDTWKSAGNIGDYSSTRMSYRCVLEGDNF